AARQGRRIDDRARRRRRQLPPLPHVPLERRQSQPPHAEDARGEAHGRRVPSRRRAFAVRVARATLSGRRRRTSDRLDIPRRSRGSTMSLPRIPPLAVAVLVSFASFSSAAPPPAPAAKPLKIGIIGAGHIGGTLAKLWVQAGHEVLISSRHPDQ